MRLVQVAVPSRTGVEAYQEFRTQVDELVGRINGTLRHAALGAGALHLPRALRPRTLVALYRAADVMLVTPLRDGMNLVAKEFVASRTDGDGVLVLSEFAGAASELAEALQVNPYDVTAPRTSSTARSRWNRRSGAPASRRSGLGSRRSTSTAGWPRSSNSSVR